MSESMARRPARCWAMPAVLGAGRNLPGSCWKPVAQSWEQKKYVLSRYSAFGAVLGNWTTMPHTGSFSAGCEAVALPGFTIERDSMIGSEADCGIAPFGIAIGGLANFSGDCAKRRAHS